MSLYQNSNENDVLRRKNVFYMHVSGMDSAFVVVVGTEEKDWVVEFSWDHRMDHQMERVYQAVVQEEEGLVGVSAESVQGFGTSYLCTALGQGRP